MDQADKDAFDANEATLEELRQRGALTRIAEKASTFAGEVWAEVKPVAELGGEIALKIATEAAKGIVSSAIDKLADELGKGIK